MNLEQASLILQAAASQATDLWPRILRGWGGGKENRKENREVWKGLFDGPLPVSVQAHVPHKLVQVPVGAFTLHSARQNHEAVDVFHL